MMIIDRQRSAALLLAIASTVASRPAPAQEAPQASTQGSSQDRSQTGRGLERFGPPTATPTPVTALPVPPAPVIVLPTPRVVETPTPSRIGAARAVATPSPAARPAPDRVERAPAPASPAPAPLAPTTEPSPASSASPLPQSRPTPAAIPGPAQTATTFPWPWLIGIGLVLLAGAAWLIARRKSREDDESEPYVAEPPPAPAVPTAPPAMPAPAMLTPPPPPPAPVRRARLGFALRPLRAGLNMITATVECEVTITNHGEVAADATRLFLTLVSAQAGQDAELDAIYAQPVGRPASPPFVLQPGEERTVKAILALGRDAIRPLGTSGRPTFVPVVAANLLYVAAAGIKGQTTQAFAIGIERGGSTKLAPFRLDGPTGAQDTVAARAHAPAVER